MNAINPSRMKPASRTTAEAGDPDVPIELAPDEADEANMSARPTASRKTQKGQAISEAATKAPTPDAAKNNLGKGAMMPAQLAGIEVVLSVEVGSHRLPLRDLLSVEAGQLFPLDRLTSEPVTVLVNGRPFAAGEIVSIGDRFGVRLLDILSGEAE